MKNAFNNLPKIVRTFAVGKYVGALVSMQPTQKFSDGRVISGIFFEIELIKCGDVNRMSIIN